MKIKHKKQILKSSKKKATNNTQGISIRITANLSIKTLQARREWQDIIKVMEEKNLQSILLCPAKFSSDMKEKQKTFSSVQFSSIAQSCPTLCDPINRSMPGLPVHHQLLEFIQIYVHWVSHAIQPSHPLLSPSPPAPNPAQHHRQAKAEEFNTTKKVLQPMLKDLL